MAKTNDFCDNEKGCFNKAYGHWTNEDNTKKYCADCFRALVKGNELSCWHKKLTYFWDRKMKPSDMQLYFDIKSMCVDCGQVKVIKTIGYHKVNEVVSQHLEEFLKWIDIS